MRNFKLVISWVLAAGLLAVVPAQTKWVKRSPLPTAENLKSVIWADSLFVAAGEYGAMLTSPDGITWTARTMKVGERPLINSVVWTGTQFVALAVGGYVWTSPDAVTWTKRAGTGNQDARVSLVWTGTLLVAVGIDGALYTSPDGIAWTMRNSGTTRHLLSVAKSGSLVAAVGDSGTIVVSPDGINWAPRTSGTTKALNAITWKGDQFVAVGNDGVVVIGAADGSSWALHATGSPNRLMAVAWMGNKLVATGFGGAVFTSISGSAWNLWASGTTEILLSLAWSGTRLVAVGYGGSVLTSENGSAWTSQTSGVADFDLNTVLVGPANKLVAAGSKDSVFTSTDGINWTRHGSNADKAMRHMIWTGNQYVAVGDSGTAITSPNGSVWTRRTIGGIPKTFRSVAYIGGKPLVAVADGGTSTSDDAIAWSWKPIPGVDLNSVIRVGTQFLAVGDSGVILASSDGMTWSPQVSGTQKHLYAVAYDEAVSQRKVAVGEGGTIVTSISGAWAARTSGTTYDLLGVTWANNLFIATGSSGTILTSPDGITWTPQTSGVWEYLRAAAWTGSQFVVVGGYTEGINLQRYGIVLTSAPTPVGVRVARMQALSGLSARLSPSGLSIQLPGFLGNGGVRFSIYDMAGQRISVYQTLLSGTAAFLPVESIGSGAYLVEAEGAGRRVVSQVDIER